MGKIDMINRFRGDYYFLSNFYMAPIKYDGILFTNNEAAFQAQKCVESKDKERFSDLNPSEAKKMGRCVALRKDWEKEKTRIMYEICYEKFSQNPRLKKALLDTGDEELIEENTWGDMIWGCVDGIGENRLGKILMKVREELRNSV